ncbi:unnamed protein product [Candidula unifasciata]|uniref:Dynein regulatory complex protein 9 n=1 Tax=Candidula unifasciata TaxID=100452 RepID=A0A8S3Z3A6_9EUPU|nr:unnamed protein product [Candidula unifasciata]
MSLITTENELGTMSTGYDLNETSFYTEESLHSEQKPSSSLSSHSSSIFNQNLTTPGVGRLHPVHAINVAVVLEELSDRLAVLGKGLSAPMIDLRTASSMRFDQAHRPQVNFNMKGPPSILGDEWVLRQNYDTVLPRRIQQMNRSALYQRLPIDVAVKDSDILYRTDHGKMEISRAFAQDVVDRTLTELIQEFAFLTLIRAVRGVQRKQLQDSNQVKSYWKNKQHIKRLKVELKKIGVDNDAETKRFKMALWTLQDSLQEHNIRSEMENKYTVHLCQMRLSKSKKICTAKESVIQGLLMDMKKKYQFEYSVHAAMVHIINKLKSEAEAKLEYWLDKYEVDKENLTRSLDTLKAERAKCLERIAWIRDMTANYKPIVKDDQRVKKIEADRLARLELMSKKAVRIQAWWRGTMVRKGLGPYSRQNVKKDAKKNTKKKSGGKKKKKK